MEQSTLSIIGDYTIPLLYLGIAIWLTIAIKNYVKEDLLK